MSRVSLSDPVPHTMDPPLLSGLLRDPPVQPAAQRQNPLTGSQPSALTQSHLSPQTSPYDPSWRGRPLLGKVRWKGQEMDGGLHATYGAGQVAVLVPPAWGAGAGAVDGVAGRRIGALARLVAAGTPGATGARKGAVHPLPTWTGTQSKGHGRVKGTTVITTRIDRFLMK